MTTLVISANAPYGQMTSQMISKIMQVQAQMERLHDAIATASSGYTGTDGTQFEQSVTPTQPFSQNLFGVMPGAVAGTEGVNYRFAVDSLYDQWKLFWAAAEPFVNQLDNGQQAFP
jgi:hypothetical protein